MHFKKLLVSSLATFFLLASTASFAQDNTIYMDEDAFNEALSNAGGSLEKMSENLQSFSENVGGIVVDSSNEPIPVDGGLGLLLVAGLGYGANRIRKQRNSRKTEIQ